MPPMINKMPAGARQEASYARIIGATGAPLRLPRHLILLAKSDEALRG